ncbi:helix-turn-helix transcriptional regulator [Candidatus Nitrosotenuis chungbukensis]|uniref:helix-turn-helix transcriptional regulator n=1 Tax=Candidatus Nitrosotenuis chungbukensis TaxID=1353246 RepID=UPI0005B298CD|nr:transcriptional regulator [Candidatus Nitrosotenuis chungbukensis]
MAIDSEILAPEFLEISSEQRLNIILGLNTEKSNLSNMARRLDATAAEVHRNFSRLQKAGFVRKDSDGNYELTLYGKIICTQIPTFSFMIKNKKYFESHDLMDIPTKYIQRIGALADSKLITGYVKVMEEWENIYKNSKKYIYNILIEIPYNEGLLKILENKLENKTKIESIFSEDMVVSKERRDLLSKFNFSKFIKSGALERKMMKNVKIAMVLNENEAGLSFPTNEGEPDMSKMLYSSDKSFHEWCFDFFNESWKNATAFQESKIA